MKTPGLSADQLFQYLEKLPAASEVTVEFLEKKVWWWRTIPDSGVRMWIEDASQGWPRCELFYNLFAKWPTNRVPRSREEARELAIEACSRTANANPQFKHVMACWWAEEVDAAKGYELEARDKGSYPCGVPYNRLTRAQRKEWINKYWRLNLNTTPPIWKEGDPPHDFDPDKLTSLFRLGLGHFARGASVGVRFYLRHGNGHIVSALKQLFVEERKRRGISDTGELQRKDPVRIREARQFITKERQRLAIPNPKHEGTDRRPLGADRRPRNRRSWADIENIDIRTRCRGHSSGITTSRTRQRESVTRRKLLSPHERRLQVVNWKLTALPTAPLGGSVTRTKS